MTAKEKSLTELANTAAERLSTLRSETALRLHLATMEVKDAWSEVSPQIENLEHRLAEVIDRHSTGQARLELHLALMEVRDRWSAIEPKVADLAGEAKAGIKHAFEELGAAIDRLRLDKAS